MTELFILGVLVVIYIIGFAISVADSTAGLHCRDDFYSVDTHSRDAEPRDVWRALVWPIMAVFKVFRALMGIFNAVIQYPILLIGYKYKDTTLDRVIRRWCDKEY